MTTLDEELFYMKVGDTDPPIYEQLTDGNGDLLPLSGATVHFHLTAPDGSIAVTGLAEIDDIGQSIVKYTWADGSPTVAGLHKREWEITFFGGEKLTVPNYKDGYPVVVSKQLA